MENFSEGVAEVLPRGGGITAWRRYYHVVSVLPRGGELTAIKNFCNAKRSGFARP